MAKVILSLGSNIGDRQRFLRDAVISIDNKIGEVLKISSLYETTPWGFSAEKQFLNMSILIETEFSPKELLLLTQDIERKSGRLSKTAGKYESRNLDIDIIFYDDMIYYDSDLQIPHKYAHKRKFVLVPTAEICPYFVHPLFKKTIIELLHNCEDENTVNFFGKLDIFEQQFNEK